MIPDRLDLPAEHVAALYDSYEVVVARIAGFIAEGLRLEERVLVVCTLPHWSLIATRLESDAVPYGRATGDGRLVFVDAEEVVDAIVESGTVRTQRFGDILGPLLGSGTRTRVYGEVVSLLAQRGKFDAAMQIEQLGQQLAHTRGIQVLCGYHVYGQRTLTPAEVTRIREVHDQTLSEGESARVGEGRTAEERQFHAVRFYRDCESLAGIVGRFLGEGFVAGSPAVVIATAVNREAIRRALAAQFFDVARLERAGELIMVDAEAALDQFMVNGMPDPALFRSAVTPLLEKAGRGRKDCVVRAYGEMVDVLWKADRTVAAVRLETLWNQLAQSHAFSLLCGYSMGHFYKDTTQQEICRQHTHVISDSGEATILH